MVLGGIKKMGEFGGMKIYLLSLLTFRAKGIKEIYLAG
jgi:hypothetical protein